MAIFCASSSMELSKRNHFRHQLSISIGMIRYICWLEGICMLIGDLAWQIFSKGVPIFLSKSIHSLATSANTGIRSGKSSG